jgi:hypothetical protein
MFGLESLGAGLLDPVVRFLQSRFLEASGWLALILGGRWLIRAQAVAAVARTVGLFAILLGVLAAVGAFDPSVVVELAGWLVGLANGGGLP